MKILIWILTIFMWFGLSFKGMSWERLTAIWNARFCNMWYPWSRSLPLITTEVDMLGHLQLCDVKEGIASGLGLTGLEAFPRCLKAWLLFLGNWSFHKGDSEKKITWTVPMHTRCWFFYVSMSWMQTPLDILSLKREWLFLAYPAGITHTLLFV